MLDFGGTNFANKNSKFYFVTYNESEIKMYLQENVSVGGFQKVHFYFGLDVDYLN